MNEKFAVITGGTKGIGKSIVNKFLNEGFSVITCSRSTKDFEELQKELKSSKMFFKETDLNKEKDVHSLCDFVSKKTPHIDVLVNNAGIFLPGSAHSGDEKTMTELLMVNFWSAFRLTSHITPGMIKRQKGHIFNICSIANLGVYPPGNMYAISKYALHGYTRALRDELKNESVKVTAVHPGATESDSWKGSGVPSSRLASSEDLAKMIFDAYDLSERTVIEEIIIRPQEGDFN